MSLFAFLALLMLPLAALATSPKAPAAKCPEKDHDFCVAWKRCNAADIPSCIDVAHRYETGLHVKASVNKAVAFYAKGCTKTAKVGCFPGAQLLLTRSKLVTAPSQAATFLKLGCTSKHPRACSQLSWMYLHGEGVTRDLAKAQAAGALGCKHKNRRACYVVASATMLSAKDKAARAKAVGSLKAYCKEGYGVACMGLSLAYKSGLIGDGKPNPTKAQAYLMKGCEAIDGRSCYELALIKIAAKAHSAVYLSLLERSCGTGYKPACTKRKSLLPKVPKVPEPPPLRNIPLPRPSGKRAAPAPRPVDRRQAPRRPAPRRPAPRRPEPRK